MSKQKLQLREYNNCPSRWHLSKHARSESMRRPGAHSCYYNVIMFYIYYNCSGYSYSSCILFIRHFHPL